MDMKKLPVFKQEAVALCKGLCLACVEGEGLEYLEKCGDKGSELVT